MNYLRILFQHWLAILLTSVIVAAVTVGLSFLPTQLYSSEVQLLIIQKQAQFADPYATQKAAEKIGKNLSSVIETFDFMNRVLATNTVSADLFSSSTEQRKKQWAKVIDSSMVPETGVLSVTAYGPTPEQAEDIAMAVMQVLTTNSADYYGGATAVEIKHIDGPITSTRPVKPNIALNGVAGLVLSMIAMSLVFVVREELRRANAAGQQLRYEVPGTQAALPPSPNGELYPAQPVEYKVLDEYPTGPYVYGAELKDGPKPTEDDGEAVGMQDHLK